MKRRHLRSEEFEPVILPGYLGDAEVNRAQGEAAYPGVVRWLTEGTLARESAEPPTAAQAAPPAMTQSGEAASTFTASDSWDSCIETIEEFYRKGWTDGLPVVPPTPDLIARMVEGCGRDLQEVLGPVPPRMGVATVETVAANAVMAGCRPDYFPVVLAAVEAALDERFNLNGLQATTHPAGPLVIVSGPIVDDLDINYGTSAFGPGFRANATIGRALRLVMMVLGGGYPETGDKSVLGSPGKYVYCIGESPDAPLGAAPRRLRRGERQRRHRDRL